MIIGLDIGGTKIRAAGSHLGRKIKRSTEVKTPTNQRQVLPVIEAMIRDIAGRAEIDALGIACPGPIDKSRGMVITPRNLNWRNLKLTSPLEKTFDCPVILEHDATCGAVAEARIGAATKARLVLYVTISTGIGTGLVLDKKPLPTRHNSEGGSQIIDYHSQHAHGQIGSFEHVSSGEAIKGRYGKIAAQITSRASWEVIAYDLAVGLHNLIAILSPDIVVLGGGVSLHHRKFLSPMQKYIASFDPLYPPSPIVPAHFIETAPLLGAMLLASHSA